MKDDAHLKMLIDLHERNKADLLARYGFGVRPAWVSADLSMIEYHLEKYRKELEND